MSTRTSIGVSVPIERAATPPSPYHLDTSVYEREKERIFRRTWQLVARADDLARPGDFLPTTILDEPVVIAHGTVRRGPLLGAARERRLSFPAARPRAPGRRVADSLGQ